jgi:hypothetical protein
MEPSTGTTSENQPLDWGRPPPSSNVFTMRQFWKFVQLSENAQAARIFVESQGWQLINSEYLKNMDSYRNKLIDQNIFRMPPPNCILLDKTTAVMSFPNIDVNTPSDHAIWLNANEGLHAMCRTGADLPKKIHLYVFTLARKKIVVKFVFLSVCFRHATVV